MIELDNYRLGGNNIVSQILWAIDNEIDPRSFERLCTDLMHRIGYKEIMPIGGNYDGGRDAQLLSYHCMGNNGEDTFFQYSLDKDWEHKLERELKKVFDNGHKISRFIFVTSQKVTGAKMDKLRRQIKNHYGWNLVIYSREWLRLQLEESSKDIASKYVGIPTPSYQGHNMLLSKIDVSQEEISELICDEKYEMAILALKNVLENSDRLEEVHNGLAWCYYRIYDYKNALIHIDLALRANPESIISKSIKGCILAEDGIATHSKTKLLLAKEIFNYVVELDKNKDSCYNLANTLSALGEYENAKKLNIESLKFNNKRAFILKNLGTCYFYLNDHKKELVCMEIALSIDPDLPEALISKGVTLGVVYKNYVDGLYLINSALENDKSLAYRWPYVYYWKSIFLSNLNNIPEALTQLEEGLTISPSNLYLLNLKAELLSQLWKTDANFLSKAAEFFEFRIKIKLRAATPP